MAYQLNLPIPDDIAAEVKTFAERYGISIAAAVRILLRQALENEEKQS